MNGEMKSKRVLQKIMKQNEQKVEKKELKRIFIKKKKKIPSAFQSVNNGNK